MDYFAVGLGCTIVLIVSYKVLGSTWYMIERVFRSCVLYVAHRADTTSTMQLTCCFVVCQPLLSSMCPAPSLGVLSARFVHVLLLLAWSTVGCSGRNGQESPERRRRRGGGACVEPSR